MRRFLTLRIIALATSIVALSLVLFAGLHLWTTQWVLPALVSAFMAISLSLSAVLTRVWLVEQYPAVKSALERLPFVAFSMPIPEHLKTGQFRAKEDFAQYQPASKNDITEPAPESHTPFTLGTLEFEPPEPIARYQPPAEVPVLERVVQPGPAVSVENAFHKSTGQPAKNIRQAQLKRFFDICRLLKQANVEVSVWTEGELATLANTMLGARSDDTDMLALLTPQFLVKIKTARTFEFGYHAKVLKDITLATGNRVVLDNIQSQKDGMTGLTEVSFRYQGKAVCWNFTEPGNLIAENFLSSAIKWVAKRANGQFHILNTDEYQKSLVFVPHSIRSLLNTASAVA